MTTEYSSLLVDAVKAYTVRLGELGLEPEDSYLPYDFTEIDRRKLSMPGAEMIRDEIREITNRINSWHGSLQRWHAWNNVLKNYGDSEAWDLRREFLEPLAHYCLIQPSSCRDALTFVATNAVHQVRIAQGGYPDRLEGDPERPGKKPKHLSRRGKEARLQVLIAAWPQANKFLSLLRNVDDPMYRQATHDYRNRSSHAIGPRIAFGLTQAVVRMVVQATQMTKQADGTFKEEPIADKLVVRYGIGGTPPLDPEEARVSNLTQYRHARACYECFRTDLALSISTLPNA